MKCATTLPSEIQPFYFFYRFVAYLGLNTNAYSDYVYTSASNTNKEPLDIHFRYLLQGLGKKHLHHVSEQRVLC